VTPVGAEEAAYVAAVLMQYMDLPDTPLRPSLTDQALARKLHSEVVPLTLVESALLFGDLAADDLLSFRRSPRSDR
jgi:hypothetical protein